MSTPILAAAGRGLSFVYLFIRFAVLNFSLMLPLLGAATVSSGLSATVMPGLVAIATDPALQPRHFLGSLPSD